MPYTSLQFPPYLSTWPYSKFDVIQGVTAGDNSYYFSTQSNNQGNSPATLYTYEIAQVSRSDDTTTITYTWNGGPPFAPGSMVAVQGVTANTSMDYTGMIVAGGSGFISYLNAGWPQGFTPSAGTITSVVNPAWTSGFFFVPGYSTTVESQQNVITAAFEPGYEQRQAASINPNVDQYNLVFGDRSNKEAKAIRTFTQICAGVYSFPIMIPIPELDNQPNAKFVTTAGARISTKSWNINDVTVSLRQTFDQ